MARPRPPLRAIFIFVGLVAMMVALFPHEARLKMKVASIFRKPLLIYHQLSQELKGKTRTSQLTQENERLRKEIANMALQLQEVSLENERLRRLLSFSKASQLNTVAARVIGRNLSNWSREILLDKGERNGIRPGQAVLVPEGFVGKVNETGETLSKVTLLDDTGFRLSVILETSRDFGMVEGSGEGKMKLKYLGRDYALKKGEKVITSGLDPLIPKGMPVARVEKVEERGLYRSAFLVSEVKFSRLEEVLVVIK